MIEVIATIDEDSQTTIEVKGARGKTCQEITRSLEQLGRVASDTPTPDMNLREDNREQQRINTRRSIAGG